MDSTWQIQLRQKLGLKPEMNDDVSRLLWHAIEGAVDKEWAIATVQSSIEDLQHALREMES